MNLKKKSLILILGISTILIALFVLGRGLFSQKARASPATCAVNGDLAVSGIIRGRMDCYALKIECNGNCGALGGSVDDKCIAGFSANYRALSVACANPTGETGYSTIICGTGAWCESIPIASANIGEICADRAKAWPWDPEPWDIVLTCCRIP